MFTRPYWTFYAILVSGVFIGTLVWNSVKWVIEWVIG